MEGGRYRVHRREGRIWRRTVQNFREMYRMDLSIGRHSSLLGPRIEYPAEVGSEVLGPTRGGGVCSIRVLHFLSLAAILVVVKWKAEFGPRCGL